MKLMVFILSFLIFLQVLTPVANSSEPLPHCSKAEVAFYGKLDSTRLEEGKIIHHSDFEKLPEKWDKRAGEFNTMFVVIKDEPPADVSKLKVRYSLNEGRSEAFTKTVGVISTLKDKTQFFELEDTNFFEDLVQNYKYVPGTITLVLINDGKDICEFQISIGSSE